ncbi:MAG TPA: serine/threonine-protein kinase [Streptosporangiaceae bacterium]
MSQGGPEEGWLLANRYRMASIVGRGGMGTVWQARDEVLDRDVAVKEVLVQQGVAEADREMLHQRMLREARATARLNHPNIVTVHDVVEEGGRPWIVMEFVRARSLQDIIDQDGPQQPRRVAELGRQTLAALRAAHAIGIVHRDVKPSNVLITDDDGRAVLTDFGIAFIEGDTNLTQTGLIVGSPAYIAPERAQGRPAEPASDLWALGATLYTACEGRQPYQRNDAVSVMAAILTEDPPPPRNAGPLGPVLQGLLQRDPARRMPAETAAGLLAQIATDTTVPVPAPVPAGPVAYARTDPAVAPPREATMRGPGIAALDYTTGPQRPAGRSGTTIGLLAAVGVLTVAVIVLAAFFVRSMGDEDPPRPGQSTTPAQQGANAQGNNGNSPAASPSPATASAAAPQLPAGWTQAGGPGYTIGVPAGWQRSVEGRSVFWRDPNSAAYVQVDRTEWTGAPYEAWQQWEGEVLAKNALENYSRVDLRNVDGAPYEAADIEFTWFGKSGRPMHGVDRRVIANGQRYAVFVAIPADQWSASQDQVNGFLDSFRPSP